MIFYYKTYQKCNNNEIFIAITCAKTKKAKKIKTFHKVV